MNKGKVAILTAAGTGMGADAAKKASNLNPIDALRYE